MDEILDILRAMRLTGGVFLEARFTAPWCVTARIGPEDCTPFLAQPRSIIAYHYVSAGRMLLAAGGEPPLAVEAGEIVVLPGNDEHVLGSTLDRPGVSASRLVQSTAEGGLAQIDHGGGGAETRLLCGFLASEAADPAVTAVLPRVLKIAVADGVSATWVESSFRFAAQELASGGGRSAAVLGKLAELLFMAAVRRYLASVPPDETQWIGGLRDPSVRRALALLHARLDRDWTVEDLAREVGLSRSAFADRFTRALGEPPMQYISAKRMEAAARRLRETRDPLARIAFDIGYESEAAFNRAFKRRFGVPPATWRRQQLAERGGGGERPGGGAPRP